MQPSSPERCPEDPRPGLFTVNQESPFQREACPASRAQAQWVSAASGPQEGSTLLSTRAAFGGSVSGW